MYILCYEKNEKIKIMKNKIKMKIRDFEKINENLKLFKIVKK